MKISRDKYLTVKVVGSDGGFITSQSVESNLLFELLQLMQSGLTQLAPDEATCAAPDCGGDMELSLTCKVCGSTRLAGKA